MTVSDKKKLITQASKLYALASKLERHRRVLKCLVEKKVPYNSEEMKEALENYQKLENEWESLEQQHLQFRKSLGQR